MNQNAICEGRANPDSVCSYEEAVRRLRLDPHQAQLVEQCYLDADVGTAGTRFAASGEFRETVRLLRLDRGTHRRTIVDLGCGNGIAAYAFGSLGHHVIAVDPDPSGEVGLGSARRLADRLPPGAMDCVKASVDALPLADASADIVYARQVLHHFRDLKRGVRECARVLKKGGWFLAAREHVISRDEDLEPFLASHPLHRYHGGENAHVLAAYQEAFWAAGLRVVRCIGPWDSIITSFPRTDAETRAVILQSLGTGCRAMALRALMGMPGGELQVRRFFSRNDSTPGRLYAFLCRK